MSHTPPSDEASAPTGPVVVTGCSSGIGRAVCSRLLEASCELIGVSRTPPDLEAPGFRHQPCDLSEPSAVTALGRRLRDDAPAAVVLSAGAGRFGSLEELSPDQIRALVDLDLVAPMLLVRELLPGMKRAGGGRLIFIGSESGRRGGAYGSVYSAAKFGLRGFAQSLRHEASRSGIGVTVVNPGMVRTAFFDDLGFEPGPEEDQALLAADVADAVLLALHSRQGTVIDEIDLSPLKKVVRKKRPADR